MRPPNILVVHPSLPVKRVKDLVALAKSRPGEITYASSGAGTSQHLGGALLGNRAGVELSHVPYKDAAVAMSDVIGGRVTLFFGGSLFTLPQVQAGKVCAIAGSSLRTVSRHKHAGQIPLFWYKAFDIHWYPPPHNVDRLISIHYT